MMRFWISISLCISLAIGVWPSPAQAIQSDPPTPTSSADFLPQDVWLYAQVPSAVDWLGQSWTLALFAFPEESDALFPIPNLAFIIEGDSPDYFDGFLQGLTPQNGWQVTAYSDSMQTYLNEEFPIAYGLLQVQQYLVISESGTINALVQALLAPSEYPTLAQTSFFQSMQAEFDLPPQAVVYSSLLQRAIALYAGQERWGVDYFWQTDPPEEALARPFDPQVLQAVPISAWGIIAGMDLNLWLQRLVDFLRQAAQSLGGLNDNLSNLPQQLEALLRVALGINVEQDLIPLFGGGYALYAAQTQATVGTWPLGLEGGFILAPDEPRQAIITLTRLGNRLGQNLGFTPELTAQAQLTIQSPDEMFIPDLVYGVEQSRFVYWTSPSGALAIQTALNGPNITDSQVWEQALEAAPSQFQQMAYLNLQPLLATLAVALQAQELALPWQSLALYQRQDLTGFGMVRALLLLED
jgi:hypothetical protein